MSTNKKGVAIVGFGGMGSWHKRKLLASDVAELRGIWDIKESRRQKALEENIHVYSSFEDLLSDESVDIVTIAVPNELHKPLSIAALEAGKHVICEKPVCLSCKELEEIIAASARTGKLFTTHQNRRWDADFLLMKQVYESGDLGEITNIESRVQGSHGIPGDWRGKKEHGGGMILDWGVHLIDQTLQMVKDKRIERIYCRCDHITNYVVDDGFKLELIYDDESRAYIELGTYNFIAMPRFYMQGMSGTALITDWREKAKVTKCKYWHESDVVPVETAAGLTKTMAPRDSVTVDEYEVEKPASNVHDYYRNFCATIDGKATQLVTYEDMLFDMKVMEAAFKSAELGQVIEF